jgi:hypothetical protein
VSVYKLSNVGGLKTKTAYTSFLAGNSQYVSPTYEAIATTTLATAAASITFSSIPTDYTHLQVRIWGYNNSGSDRTLWMQFNSDSGSNYRNHYLAGTGAAISASADSAATVGILPYNGPSSATGFNGDSTKASVVIMDILDYTNTNKYTTVRTIGGWDGNGSGQIYFSSGLWMNTAAITNLYFHLPYSTLVGTGTKMALYGIKG